MKQFIRCLLVKSRSTPWLREGWGLGKGGGIGHLICLRIWERMWSNHMCSLASFDQCLAVWITAKSSNTHTHTHAYFQCGFLKKHHNKPFHSFIFLALHLSVLFTTQQVISYWLTFLTDDATGVDQITAEPATLYSFIMHWEDRIFFGFIGIISWDKL